MRVRIGMMTAFAALAFAPMVNAQEQAEESPRERVQETREETRDSIQEERQEARENIQQERENLREQRREVAEERREDRRVERRTTNPMWQTAMQAEDMEQSMASCLILANHAEIELADLAIAKSQNPDVKQFAQKMKEDHSAAIKELKQFTPSVATSTAKANDGEQTAENTATASAAQLKKAKQFHNPMLKMMQEIAKNELSMTKDLLNKYEGQDFDMGYLGQQLVAHTQMLAKLHAMKDQGTPEFKMAAQEMIKTVEEHFTMATELSKKFEDQESGAVSDAQQPSTPAVRKASAPGTTTN